LNDSRRSRFLGSICLGRLGNGERLRDKCFPQEIRVHNFTCTRSLLRIKLEHGFDETPSCNESRGIGSREYDITHLDVLEDLVKSFIIKWRISINHSVQYAAKGPNVTRKAVTGGVFSTLAAIGHNFRSHVIGTSAKGH